MRKVELTMDEQKKYETIKKLSETGGNKKRAALELGCTLRHVNRMLEGYRKEGKAFFLHGNRGRQPIHTISKETRKLVVDLYSTKYYDANFKHYSQLLKQHESLTISPSAVRGILMENDILSPKAQRSTRKAAKKRLKEQETHAKTTKQREAAQAAIVALENAHSRRPRCAYAGECLQMDASLHLWFGNTKTQLHLAIDDATGIITGAHFDFQETLNGYYHVTYQTLCNYGIPYEFSTDRRTVFEYKKKNAPSLEEDTFTQFSYACKQLGIAIRTSSIPQAKGRVERVFGTLQSRLPVELRLAGITTLKAANEFLHSYIKEFNAMFALPLHDTNSVFEMQPEHEKICQILAVLTERTVDSGHCIRFQNKYYRMISDSGMQIHFRKGTKRMVVKTFDQKLYCSVESELYLLDEIPLRHSQSRQFDNLPPTQPKKPHIPSMNHPWRRKAFWNFIHKEMAHHKEDTAFA